MATVVPSAIMVRRLLPSTLLLGAFLAVCILGFAATEHMLSLAPVPVAVVIYLIWFVSMLRAHPNEWRFGRVWH